MGIINRLNLGGTPAEAIIVNVSRRQFLQGAGGFALGIYLGGDALAGTDAAAGSGGSGVLASAPAFEPNAFIRIGTDNTVTVLSKHLEMGQGTFTGLATLVAEELDADWAQIRIVGAPADNKKYANTLLGVQVTGGSTAMANSWEQMRKAGASARAMLVSAAATEWNVPADQITVDDGVLLHAASGHKASFGALAEKAALQSVPKDVALKDPKQFKLIGKTATRRKDSDAKTDGTAIFTQDVKLPDMLVAVVAHAPRFGATIKAVDASKATAVPGVIDVVQFAGKPGVHSAGVAVLAKNTWVAKQGRDALLIEWDDSKAYTHSSEQIFADYRELAKKPGLVAGKTGNAAAKLAKPGKSARVIEAEYEYPYLAHAAMEPLNCLVKLGKDQCEIWNGEQMHTPDQGAVAAFLKMPPEKVTITQLYAGGSFGRRANPQADFVLEAVAIAKAASDKGLNVPIKMVWTREEDMRGGFYRPANLHSVRAALDEHGALVAWQERIVGQSIMKGTPFEPFAIKKGIDSSSVEGASDIAYAIPNLQVELHSPQFGVPVQWWRSVGHTHTAYTNETMIDELATAAGKDPLEFRRTLLEKKPRHLGVLELAADKAGWSQPLAPAKDPKAKRGRGFAVHESFNTFVAEIVEVTVDADGQLKIDRVVCAVDCGVAINPDIIKAQMEGGIGFGLSAALHSAITLKDGVVEQKNFDGYAALRINEMPAIEVYIVPSAEKPTGVGEPGTPPSAPALANAIFAATGKRIRKLPIADQLST